MIIKYGDRKLFELRLPFSKQSRGGDIDRGLLPETGRSSKDVPGFSLLGELQTLDAAYDFLNPYVPVEVLKYITLMSLINPDVSQARKIAMMHGNNGHRIFFNQAKQNDAVIDAAQASINAIAPKLCDNTFGVDGLFNILFNQQAVSGAISAEFGVNNAGDGIDRVLIVPTFTIRFKYEEMKYKAYQYLAEYGGDLRGIELNPLTYSYIASDRTEHSPYAIPPYVAALESLLIQKDMFTNIRYMIKKLGLLGLNVVKVKKLQRDRNESDEKYTARNQKHLAAVAKALENNYYKGILVISDDQELANHSLTQDARGVENIVRMIEEQVCSGINIDPAMLGRNYSSTETYAEVVYDTLIASLGNMRQAIKRFMEKGYMLHLALAGIPVDGITLRFKGDKRLKPNIEALAELYRLSNTLKKAQWGMIPPDAAAQEQGVDEWYDTEKLDAIASRGMMNAEQSRVLAFEYNKNTGRYEFVRPSHRVARIARHTTEGNDEAAAGTVEKNLETWVTKYLDKVMTHLDTLKDKAVIDFAVEYARNHIEEISQDAGTLLDALKEHLKTLPVYKNLREDTAFKDAIEKLTVDAAKYFKEKDLSVFGEYKPDVTIKFGEGDLKAAQMHRACDHHYFSKFLAENRYGSEIRKFTEAFFKRGESVQNGWTDEIEKEFRARFGAALEGDLHKEMRLIVESGLGRVQTYTRIEQMYEGGIIKAVIVGREGCCDICSAMLGTEFIVADVRQVIQEGFVNAESTAASLEFIKKTGISIEDTKEKIEDLVARGAGFPKYHPYCFCTVKGVVE